MVDRESGDVVWVFADLRAALGAMEPPEVTADAYLVFDCRGHLATLGVERWDTKIEGWSTEPHPDHLRDLLTRFLVSHRRTPTDTADLDELVVEAGALATEVEYTRTHPRVLVPFLKWWRGRASGSV